MIKKSTLKDQWNFLAGTSFSPSMRNKIQNSDKKSFPAVDSAAAKKCTSYAPLLAIAARQMEQRKRSSIPIFTPFVLAHCGFLGPHDLVNSLTNAFRAHTLASEGLVDILGDSVGSRTSRFKSQLLHELQLESLRGAARAQRFVGTPWSSKSPCAAAFPGHHRRQQMAINPQPVVSQSLPPGPAPDSAPSSPVVDLHAAITFLNKIDPDIAISDVYDVLSDVDDEL